MNCASDTVLHFDVEFRDHVGLESLVLFEILFGGCINNISDIEALDGFVFGAEFSAVGADNGFDISSVLFVPSMISSLDRHVAII